MKSLSNRRCKENPGLIDCPLRAITGDPRCCARQDSARRRRTETHKWNVFIWLTARAGAVRGRGGTWNPIGD